MQLSRMILGAAAAAAMLAPAARAAEPVYVLTYAEVSAGAAKDAAGLLHDLRHDMHAHKGVLSDAMLIERGRPTRLVILDAFENKAMADAHAANLDTQTFRGKLQKLLVAPLDVRHEIGLDTAVQTRPSGPRTVFVVTHVDVVPSFKAQTETLLRSLAAAGRKMAGNLRFDLLDQDNRPNHFTLIQAWRDHRDFEAYRSAAATRDFREKLLPMQGALYDERLFGVAP